MAGEWAHSKYLRGEKQHVHTGRSWGCVQLTLKDMAARMRLTKIWLLLARPGEEWLRGWITSRVAQGSKPCGIHLFKLKSQASRLLDWKTKDLDTSPGWSKMWSNRDSWTWLVGTQNGSSHAGKRSGGFLEGGPLTMTRRSPAAKYLPKSNENRY